MRISVLFESAHATAEREVLIDSGATDNFICRNLLQRLKIAYLPLEIPLRIWNVDSMHNQDGKITHFTDLQVCTSAVFFFNDTATTEIYTLSLHDALPI